MKDIVYLDNAASTQVCDDSVNALYEAVKFYANPSSLHKQGSTVKVEFIKAAKTIENILGACENTFYFTSGATESNNWAIFGSCEANFKLGKHIITSRTEHPSILQPIEILKRRGFDISFVDVSKTGIIDHSQLANLIRKDTILVSIMNVNNETGTINDSNSIGKIVKSLNKRTIFHVDGVASFCKMKLDISNIDLYSISGHKIHAPKGIGGLYIKQGVNIKPLIYGGNQQNAMRSGTESTILAQSFAAAAKSFNKNMLDNFNKVTELKKQFIDDIENIECASIIGDIDSCSPYILNISFRGIKSQLFLNALEQEGIYVSSGSACSHNKKRLNSSLQALALNEDMIDSSVRFSFSSFNTIEEIKYCTTHIKQIVSRYKGLGI